MLISTLRVEISILQGKWMEIFDCHAVLRLRAKWPIFEKLWVGPPMHNRVKVIKAPASDYNSFDFFHHIWD